MLTDVGQAQRLRVGDQDPEDPVTAREIADGRVRSLVEANREKALEALTALVEHAEGGVAGAGQLAGDLEHVLQHALAVQFRDERPADLQQADEPLLAETNFLRFASHASGREPPGT